MSCQTLAPTASASTGFAALAARRPRRQAEASVPPTATPGQARPHQLDRLDRQLRGRAIHVAALHLMRCMVVALVTRFETQIVTRSGLGSASRTIANAATADSSCPAVSTCAMTSVSGLIGVVIVLNGAAASSPEIRASALRVTASSATGASTTTSPRHAGSASVGAVPARVSTSGSITAGPIMNKADRIPPLQRAARRGV